MFNHRFTAAAIVAGLLLNQQGASLNGQSFLPWLTLILAAGILGPPSFTLPGGRALFASPGRGTPPAVVPPTG